MGRYSRHAFRSTAVLLLLVLSLAAVACTNETGTDEAALPDTTEPGAVEVGEEGGDAFERIPQIVRAVEPSVVAIVAGRGEGSGVVYNDEGIIVTNAHVVSGRDEVEVIYADGVRADATVVGRDDLVDLAILRSERTGIPPATFSDSIPEVGELAVAIGNPLGFENTVTLGIISAHERAIPGGGPSLVGLLQTDAPISPGNSGGALAGANAEVVGINVAYIPPQGGAVSLGFAIPAPTVVKVVEALLEGGEVEHAFLGITPQTVTPELARRFDIDSDSGVAVLDVAPGSPAQEAGLEQGDVITALDGDAIRSVEDLFAALRGLEPGDVTTLTVLRGGEETEIDVTLGARSE